MNNDSPKFRHTQKQESISEQREEQNVSNAKEFSSVEELLRHDAEQTVVPPEIGVKLSESIAQQPKPKSWWRRFFQ